MDNELYLCQIVTLVAPNEAFCKAGLMMRVEFWGGLYGWAIIDTDKVPSDENYYGLCACGFESEQDALESGIGRWRPRLPGGSAGRGWSDGR